MMNNNFTEKEPIRLCVFKPTNIVNNNPFDTSQRKLFERLVKRHGLDVTLIVDTHNKYRYGSSLLNVRPIQSWPVPFCLRRFARLSHIQPFYPNLLLGKHRIFDADIIYTENPWYPLVNYVYENYQCHGTRYILNDSMLYDQVVTPRIADIVKCASKIVVTTQLVIEKYKRLGLAHPQDMHKFCIIGNPVDTELFKPPGTVGTNRDIVIVSTGRLIPEKGFQVILQALNNLVKKHPSIKLWIIGNGDKRYTESLMSLVSELKLEDNVTFLGQVNNTKLPELYASSAIFVNHSLESRWVKEAFCAVNMEAMAFGLPVVTTKCGGITEVVQDKAILVDPMDTETLTDSIDTLICDPALRARMGKEGREFMKHTYSVDVLADRLFQCLQEIVES